MDETEEPRTVPSLFSLRQHYHPNYYGAFVLDPDGHDIEAVFHG